MNNNSDKYKDNQDYKQFKLRTKPPELLIIPKKSRRHLMRSIPKKELHKIDPDSDVATEKCLIFLDNLKTTFFSEEPWKSLHSPILHRQFKRGKDNTYVYTRIIEVLSTEYRNSKPIIEVNKSYLAGERSREYRLKDTYYDAGYVEYELKCDDLITRREKFLYNRFKNAKDNPIIQNLHKVYDMVALPSKSEVLTEAKRLVDAGYITKSGKKLTFKNNRPKEHWNDHEDRSFVEISVKLFERLTKEKAIDPEVGSYRSGYRVIDKFTLMPSWIRAMVKINGSPVEESDFSALHPNILLSGLGNNFYKEAITHDKVANYLGISRDEAKLEHLSFFNKRWWAMQQSPLFKYYQDNFPDMMRMIQGAKAQFGHTHITHYLFETETEMMKEAIRRLNSKGIYVIYVYDALYGQAEHSEQVKAEMESVAGRFMVNTIAK